MPTKILAAVLTLAVALAGCTAESPPEPTTPTATPPGGGPPPANATPPPPAEPAGPVVQVFNGTVGGAGAPGGPKVALPVLRNFAEFELPNGSLGLVVELAWDTPETLELGLRIPDEHCGAASDPLGATADCDDPDGVEGASPLKIAVVEPERLAYAGTWAAAAFVAGASPGTPFTLYVSVFPTAPPAASYTAVPAG